MFNLLIDYPDRKDEISIVKKTTSLNEAVPQKIISKKDILDFQGLVLRVPMADNVIEYAVDLVSSTRPGKQAKKFINDHIEWGAGPRATQSLILGAKAHAILNGNPSVNIDDVKKMVSPKKKRRSSKKKSKRRSSKKRSPKKCSCKCKCPKKNCKCKCTKNKCKCRCKRCK